MNLFEEPFSQMDAWLAARAKGGGLQRLDYQPAGQWPLAGRRNLVIGGEVAVELGHPRDTSVACIFWGASGLSKASPTTGPPPHRLFLLGPDLPACRGRRLPFGKVVMIRGRGFDARNTYARYQRLEAVRYRLDLQGYMLRAVSQVNREWSRISGTALDRGFSFATLGSALVDAYAALEFVDSVTVLFVTASKREVAALGPLAETVFEVIAAMHQMQRPDTPPMDCDGCSHARVCREVAGLRAMHKAMAGGHG